MCFYVNKLIIDTGTKFCIYARRACCLKGLINDARIEKSKHLYNWALLHDL